MMKKLFLMPIMLIFFCVSGCGNTLPDSPAAETAAETNLNQVAYAAEPFLASHERIYSALVYQDCLYYLCSDNGSESPLDLDLAPLLVRLALDDPAAPETVPLSLVADTLDANYLDDSILYMLLSIDDSETAHILAYQYGNRENEGLVRAYWYKVDGKGDILSITDVIDALSDGGIFGIGDFIVDAAGNACVAISDKVKVIDPQGNLAFSLTCGGPVGGFFADEDGKTNIYYAGNMSDNNYLAVIDFTGQRLTEERAFSAGSVLQRGISDSGNHSLFIVATDGVYDYDLTAGEIVLRFNWFSVGITVDIDSSRAFPLADSQVLYSDLGSFRASASFRLLRPLTTEEAALAEAAEAEARVLTVAVIGSTMSGTFSERITEFTIENPHYRIEIVKYGSDDIFWPGHADYDDAMLLLDLDLAAGKAPDILYLRKAIPWRRYVIQGLLMDLRPLLDADSTFDWEDYYEHIIRAYEIDGGIYGLPDTFIIETLVAGEAKTLGKKDWNLDEFIAFVDAHDADEVFFRTFTKEKILDICLKANGNVLVDWASEGGDVNQEFIRKTLALSNRFVANEKDLERDEISLLEHANYAGSKRYTSGILGEAAAHIGYPAEIGSGYIIDAVDVVAISSACKDVEVAFCFVSSQLPKSSFNKSVHERLIESTMGTEHLDMKPPIDEQDIAAYYEVLNMPVAVADYDWQIINIIKEEATPYFLGMKTLDEVVDIIGNRLGIYARERR